MLPVNENTGGRRFLWWSLVLGAIVRLVVFWHTSSLGIEIGDEKQYTQIALNILGGHGFGWGPDALTSIRPPLFPWLLSGIWAVAGSQNFQAVRAVQIVLALATTALVYLIGARVFSKPVGRSAAAVFWLYPSYIFFNFLVLTETLFTLLLVAFLLLTVMLVQRPRAWVALGCGATLALASLTRSILWPVPLVLCPLLTWFIKEPLSKRLGMAMLVLMGYTTFIVPWAIRNTRLQQTLTIVDTMGGINLRMGNYEYTPDDRMWDAVALTGDKNWVTGFSAEAGQQPTEGRKDKWAQRKAVEYIRANPGRTFRRSLIKFADFWGIEREFIAGVQQGLFNPPRWFQTVGSTVIVLGYVLVVVLGAAGMWLAPPRDWRLNVVLLLPVVLFVVAHSVIFGHSRYHLPLIPILAMYGSQLVTAEDWSFRMARRPALVAATASVAILLTIWIRQIVFVDLARIEALLHHIA
jgi:4-amino-4-deoxy-L-arabinose transferase-like glycosyltransferase